MKMIHQRQGVSRFASVGKLDSSWQGVASHGVARFGRAGSGEAWLSRAWPGEAGFGLESETRVMLRLALPPLLSHDIRPNP